MSANIMLVFGVDGLADETVAESVANALTELVREEGLREDEVGVRWGVEDGNHWVAGQSEYPIGVSRFHAWRPHFEAAVHERVRAVVPSAEPSVTWWYPDGMPGRERTG